MSFLESAVREVFTNPKTSGDARETVGWDAPSVTRFLSTQSGVTIDKLDALLAAAGYVAVSAQYLDALATMSEVGTHCKCARQGMGECRKS